MEQLADSTDISNSQRLWLEYREMRDKDLREEIILRYRPLVHQVLGRMHLATNAVLGREDLMGYGLMGLIEAVDRFDPQYGAKFETFATSRIRGSIVDALRGVDPLSRRMRQRVSLMERTFARLEQELGRPPTCAEMEESLDQIDSKAELTMLAASSGTPISLQAVIDGMEADEEILLIDTVRDERSPNPLVEVEKEEMRDSIVAAFNLLSDRERRILKRHYYDNVSARDLAKEMGISESRVYQLCAKALSTLRGALQAYHPTSSEFAA